jgi:O-antigen/teichoic acid export membrane protein
MEAQLPVKPSTNSTRLVVLSAWSSRVVAACSTLYSLRILSHSLTAPEYATYVIIVGLAGWFALSDLGIGYAAQNAITNRIAQGGLANQEILSAYLMLAVTACALTGALYLLNEPIAEFLFAKVLEGQHSVAEKAFFQSGVLLTVSTAVALSTKVLYATHRGYIANAVAAINPILGLGLLTLGISSAEDKVTFAMMALYGPTIITGCVLAARQITNAFRSRPSLSFATFLSLTTASRGFLVFSLLGAAVLQIDYIILSQKASPTEIIQYYTIGKIFSFVAFINQAVLFATWPTLTTLYSQGNTAEIDRQLKRLVFMSSGATVVATLGVLLTKNYIGSFLAPGLDLNIRSTVIIGFGAVAAIRCLTDPFAIFLQSIGRLAPLIGCATVQALVSAALQWMLVDSVGIEGILLALLLSFALTSTWVLPLASRKLLSTRGNHLLNNISRKTHSEP